MTILIYKDKLVFMDIVLRKKLAKMVEDALRESPIVVLQGPRQCGKTTLAQQFGVPDSHFFALDDPLDTIRLEENARTTLANLHGLIVIDEAQKMPSLFPILRVLADRRDHGARFLLLGSASTLLMKEVSETLAGRAHIIDMSGFSLDEVGAREWQRLWVQGAYPLAYQKRSEVSMKWRLDYIREFITRDLRDLGETKIDGKQIRDLLDFIASSQGGNWNDSKAADILNVSQKTVRRYLDLFRTAFIIRKLTLFSTNTTKRLRKAPKYFLRDSGLAHALHQIFTHDELLSNPILGASWESFALEQTIIALQLPEENCHTWGVQSGAEIDLVFRWRGKVYGVEFKHKEAPRSTRSLKSAIETITLERAWIVHPGPHSYVIDERIEAVSISELSLIRNFLKA